MPMGLEDWERVTGLPSLHVGEPRLQGMLGVSHFRLGPVKEDIPGTRQVRERSAAPAVRFPEWHECPNCHRIGRLGEPFELAADGGRLTCLACGGSERLHDPGSFRAGLQARPHDGLPLGMVGASRQARGCLRRANPVPGFLRPIGCPV